MVNMGEGGGGGGGGRGGEEEGALTTSPLTKGRRRPAPALPSRRTSLVISTAPTNEEHS